MLSTVTHDQDQQQAELLDLYWQRISADPEAIVPEGLDPQAAAFAARLAAEGMAPSQDAQSTDRVRNRVRVALEASTREAARGPKSRLQETLGWWQSLIPRSQLRGVVAAALVLVAALAVYMIGFKPQEVSAASVLERAEAVARSPLAGGVRTFSLKLLEQKWQDTGNGVVETRIDAARWYGGPVLWRNETRQQAIDNRGTALDQAMAVEVSDGKDFWQYDVLRNWVQVQHTAPELGGQGNVGIFGQGVVDLQALLSEASRCYEPKLAGSDTIAGRPAYKIELGQNKCAAAALPEFAGRQLVWVDKTTSFILAWELYDRAGKDRVAASEVTEIAYNQAIDPARFEFKAPEGALVSDSRPTALAGLAKTGSPAEVEAALRGALAGLSSKVGYQAFVPTYAPAGLVPRQPSLRFVDVDQGPGASPQRVPVVRIEYVPAVQVESDAGPMGRGIVIDQQQLPAEVVAAWTQGLTPTTVHGAQAWYRQGERNGDGTGTSSVVDVLQDGVLIRFNSFDVPVEELTRVAESMGR